MKYLKILGLVAIAAVPLNALLGTGTAFAGSDTCTALTSPCPSGNEYTGSVNSTLKTGTSAVITNSVDTITCTSSSINGENTVATNASGNSTGKITSVTFSGCQDQNREGCTLTAEHLPWHSEDTATEVSGKVNGNGVNTISSGGTGGPQAKAVCGGFLSCTFGVESATVSVIGSSTAPSFKTTGLALTRISGFLCPSTANWDAEYTITKPTSMFVI
jgi:hypothetical protein